MTGRDAVRDQLAAALVDSNMLHRSDPFRWDFADALLPVVDRLSNQRAAAELRAAADDRTTVSKLTPVESLTCFIVKLEDLFHRADALDPS